MNLVQQEDLEKLKKTIKNQPEKFPKGDFNISRLQRALKIGYDRACNLKELAIDVGVLAQGTKPYNCRLVNNG